MPQSLICLFASDLHGRASLYESLFREIESRRPDMVFLGGDLLPFPYPPQGDRAGSSPDDFIPNFLVVRFAQLQSAMGISYPKVNLILGNNDPRSFEREIIEWGERGLWRYVHGRGESFGGPSADDYRVMGYACVPPTPFRLKDWEKFDESRTVPEGAISPDAGSRSTPVDAGRMGGDTIADDLETLAGSADLSDTIMLFHTPPHNTLLDRISRSGTPDEGSSDAHVGSAAVRRFIEERQPLVTLHGHIHESARLTGEWRDRIGSTHMFSSAHDGPELALVTFDPSAPENATRELV